jgi:hypothetical protein
MLPILFVDDVGKTRYARAGVDRLAPLLLLAVCSSRNPTMMPVLRQEPRKPEACRGATVEVEVMQRARLHGLGSTAFEPDDRGDREI